MNDGKNSESIYFYQREIRASDLKLLLEVNEMDLEIEWKKKFHSRSEKSEVFRNREWNFPSVEFPRNELKLRVIAISTSTWKFPSLRVWNI